MAVPTQLVTRVDRQWATRRAACWLDSTSTLPPFGLRLTRVQDNPETSVAECDRRKGVEALRRPAAVARADPAAAAEHAIDARGWPFRIDGRPSHIRSPPVLTPLPHIARHVI